MTEKEFKFTQILSLLTISQIPPVPLLNDGSKLYLLVRTVLEEFKLVARRMLSFLVLYNIKSFLARKYMVKIH